MDAPATLLPRIRELIKAAADAGDIDQQRKIADDVRNAVDEALDQGACQPIIEFSSKP